MILTIIAVTYIPIVFGNTSYVWKHGKQLINVYNELQTGKENVGLLNINLMKPGNFALVIEGRTVHTLSNKFETFYDRNINIIRLLVLIYTGN